MSLRILLGCFFLIMFTSCEKVIELDLPKGYKRLVVEGWITDQPEPYVVRLTHTRDYSYDHNDTLLYERNARVVIRDNQNREEILTEVDPGIYMSDVNGMRGVVGNYYSLEVINREGKQYVSIPELLKPVPKVDTIYYRIYYNHPDRHGNPTLEGYIEFQDPPEPKDFYYIFGRIYNLEGRLLGKYDRLSVISDKFSNGSVLNFKNLDGFDPEAPVGSFRYLGALYSISENAFRFISALKIKTEQVGGPFDTPAESLIGNVANADDPKEYALGFFGASAVSATEITVIVER